MSEQNPSAEPPQPPSAPQPGPTPPPPQAPLPPPPAAPGPPAFGAAPAGSETFGAAPDQPPLPPQAAPVKKKSKLPAILITVGVVVVVLCGVGIFAVMRFVNANSAVNAKVGDCFEESVFTEELTDAGGTTTVDCTSAEAKYKVVGIVDNKRFDEMNVDADCEPFPTAVAGIWFGEEGKSGKVFCIEDITT